jgi:uncharacterized protein
MMICPSKMKKILYLHGLESKQGGKKVDFLASEGAVFAPKVDYKRDDFQNWITNIVETFNPDLVIGSSMGGYVADILSKTFDIPAILFNPAIHSRKFDPNINEWELTFDTKTINRRVVVLGMNDDVVNPQLTKVMLENNWYYTIEEGEHAHQTPLNIFIDTFNRYKNEL